MQPYATSRNLTQPHETLRKKAFTLLEVLVAIAVLGLVVTAAAGTFASIQQAWRRQRNTLDLVQNARWAIERMVNDIRGSTVSGPGFWQIAISGGGERLRFGRDTDGNNSPETRVWYWRGNGGAFGPDTIIYRGIGTALGGPLGANANRQELANFIVDNPGNDIFTNAGGGLYTIEITLRPNPTQAAGPNNRDYTLRTQVRVRN